MAQQTTSTQREYIQGRIKNFNKYKNHQPQKQESISSDYYGRIRKDEVENGLKDFEGVLKFFNNGNRLKSQAA